MMEVKVKMCSIVPFTPDRKPFWIEGSMILFARQNLPFSMLESCENGRVI